MARVVIVDDKFCFQEETHLTVHKTSVFFPGDGFVVYNPKGELIFRFDSYYGPNSRPKDELVLMDATGKCLLTLIRKVSLVVCLNDMKYQFRYPFNHATVLKSKNCRLPCQQKPIIYLHKAFLCETKMSLILVQSIKVCYRSIFFRTKL